MIPASAALKFSAAMDWLEIFREDRTLSGPSASSSKKPTSEAQPCPACPASHQVMGAGKEVTHTQNCPTRFLCQLGLKDFVTNSPAAY